MEKLKNLKEKLMHTVEAEVYGDLAHVDAKELGEVVDMIKDIAETMYYCSIVEAMEEKGEEEHHHKYYPPMYYPPVTRYPEHYRDMDRDYGKMYYPKYDLMDSHPMEVRDDREGRSPLSRKNYMEAKEMHHDKAVQMKELEAYLKELSHDVTEMVADATPEEKAMLQQKLTMLANKIK